MFSVYLQAPRRAPQISNHSGNSLCFFNNSIKGEEERIDQQIKEDSWLDYSDELSDGGL